MSELFITGTGFSKAISDKMPTMRDLAEFTQDGISQLPGNQDSLRTYEKLSSDPECLLTYLYQELPWKNPEEIYLDKSAFMMLSRLIANHIAKCEEEVFKDPVPPWTKRFVNYIHELVASKR